MDQLSLYQCPAISWKEMLQKEARFDKSFKQINMETYQQKIKKISSWKSLIVDIEQLDNMDYMELIHCRPSQNDAFNPEFQTRKLKYVKNHRKNMRQAMDSLIENLAVYVCANIVQLRVQQRVSIPAQHWKMPRNQYEVFMYYTYFEQEDLWFLPYPAVNTKQSLSNWYLNRCSILSFPQGGFDRRQFIQRRRQMGINAVFIDYVLSQTPRFRKNPKLFFAMSTINVAKKYKSFVVHMQQIGENLEPAYELIPRYKLYLSHQYFRKSTIIWLGKQKMDEINLEIEQDIINNNNSTFNMKFEEIVNSISDIKRKLNIEKNTQIKNVSQLFPKKKIQLEGFKQLEGKKINQMLQQECYFDENMPINEQLMFEEVTFKLPEIILQQVERKQVDEAALMELNQVQMLEESIKIEEKSKIIDQHKTTPTIQQEERFKPKPNQQDGQVNTKHLNIVKIFNQGISEMNESISQINQNTVPRARVGKKNIDFLNKYEYLFSKRQGNRFYLRHPSCGQWVQKTMLGKHNCQENNFKYPPVYGQSKVLGCIQLFRYSNNRRVAMCYTCGKVGGIYSNKDFFHIQCQGSKVYSLYPQNVRIEKLKTQMVVNPVLIQNLQPIHENMIFSQNVNSTKYVQLRTLPFSGFRQRFVDLIKTPLFKNGYKMRQSVNGITCLQKIPKNTCLGYYGGDIISVKLLDNLKQLYNTGIILSNKGTKLHQCAIYPVQHFRELSFAKTAERDFNSLLVFGQLPYEQLTRYGSIEVTPFQAAVITTRDIEPNQQLIICNVSLGKLDILHKPAKKIAKKVEVVIEDEDDNSVEEVYNDAKNAEQGQQMMEEQNDDDPEHDHEALYESE